MRATSSSALFLSLALHGVIAGLLVLLSVYVAKRSPIAPPVVFDLVAGPPTAPDEREAPALGNMFDVPKAPRPKADPTPPIPEPVVERQMPKTPPVPPKTPPKTPPKPTPKKKEAKKAPPKPAESKLTYEEFKKKFGTPKVNKSASTKPRVTKVPRIDAEGIAHGVQGGSTANKRGGGGGKALSRREADEMEVYEALVRNKLTLAHNEVKPEGLGEGLTAEVEFFMAANGEISNVRIVRSSGNREFDQSVLAAFRRVTWPGPRPDRRSDTWALTFKMTDD